MNNIGNQVTASIHTCQCKIIVAITIIISKGNSTGAIAFGDYNSDGYDDFALTGMNGSGDLITYVVQNGINSFIVSHILQGVYYGKPAWGDYDSDGDLDLLIAGQSRLPCY